MTTPFFDSDAQRQPTASAHETRTNPTKVLLALFGTLSASLLIIVVGLAVGVHGGDIACLLWAALSVTVAFIPLALDYGRPSKRRHIFLSMVSIAYAINFVVPVLANYIPAVGPMDPAAMEGSNLLPRDIARGQWIAIMGLIAFFGGYALPVQSTMRSVLPNRGYEWAHIPALIAKIGRAHV